MRRRRKLKWYALFHPNQNQPLPTLRHAEVRGIHDSPVTLIANFSETLQHLRNGFTAFMGRETNDVFKDKDTRAKVIYDVGELLE
jgi:hypothetical protein